MPRPSKLTPFHDLIGTVPDREIATVADVSIATVCHYRQRHGIASFRSTIAQPAAAAATPEPARVVTEDGGRNGYSARVVTEDGEQEFTLAAANLVEAARIAATAGEVLAVRYLGPFLG